MVAKAGGKWAPRRTTDGTIALWIDPLLSEPDEDRTADRQPLMTLVPTTDDQVLIRLADRVRHGADLRIYTLEGQSVCSRHISAGFTTLDRRMLEGLGIVVLHLDAGDEQMTVKALFPAK